jgi:3',5'-cyclic AMP phosphodiesterase CpdA
MMRPSSDVPSQQVSSVVRERTYTALNQQLTTSNQQQTTGNWHFAHVTDSHLGSPRSYRFRPAINARWAAIKEQIAQSGADLLLHGGDLTRDGDCHEEEYRLAKADLETLPFPVHVIPGNMDVGNKPFPEGFGTAPHVVPSDRLDLFSEYFGPPFWSFVHKNVRFTGFFAAVAGTGIEDEQVFWNFLESLPALEAAQHHVAVMHYWPFMESPDEDDVDVVDPDSYMTRYFTIDRVHRERIFSLLQSAGVGLLFCGHVHIGRPPVEASGIRIVRSPAAGNTAQLDERWDDTETRFGFHLCTVTGEGIDVAFVPGNNQCDEFDTYGPGGHPPLEGRDYAAAREQPPLEPDDRALLRDP